VSPPRASISTAALFPFTSTRGKTVSARGRHLLADVEIEDVAELRPPQFVGGTRQDCDADLQSGNQLQIFCSTRNPLPNSQHFEALTFIGVTVSVQGHPLVSPPILCIPAKLRQRGREAGGVHKSRAVSTLRASFRARACAASRPRGAQRKEKNREVSSTRRRERSIICSIGELGGCSRS